MKIKMQNQKKTKHKHKQKRKSKTQRKENRRKKEKVKTSKVTRKIESTKGKQLKNELSKAEDELNDFIISEAHKPVDDINNIK